MEIVIVGYHILTEELEPCVNCGKPAKILAVTVPHYAFGVMPDEIFRLCLDCEASDKYHTYRDLVAELLADAEAIQSN